MSRTVLGIIEQSTKLILLLAIISCMVPFSPTMPTLGIDYSWAIALNQAIAQGLVFGKDIIFTLGPYASLYTKVYHPATDGMMIVASCYLAIVYWVICVLLLKRHHIINCIAFITVMLGMVYARDVLFLSYPLILGLWIADSSDKPTPKVLYGVLFTPLGLLALIKGTFLLQILLFLPIATAYLIYTKKQQQTLISLAAASFSCAAFWLAAHQPLNALPSFIITSIKMSMGFSESMSRQGNPAEIISFLLIAAIQLMAIIAAANLHKHHKLFVFALSLLFLFISFKAGFTRHYGHAYVASTALLFSGLILSLACNVSNGVALIALSLFGCIYINGNHTKLALGQNIRATLSTAYHGISHRLSDRTWPHTNYKTLMRYISSQQGLPPLSQTSDMYSYDQIVLLASGNQWSPRPIFQSYSVFSKRLAEMNKKKLQSHPPEHIFFRLQPIDNKLPALDDGPSWRILLSTYHPSNKVNDYLILDRKEKQTRPQLNPIEKESHHLGETVKLRPHASPIYAKLSIKQTWWGKLWSFIYKPDELTILIQLQDGTTRTYRLSANLAEAEFLLSPLIETTSEFGLLFFHSPELRAKTVEALVIDTDSQRSLHWQRRYVLEYQ